MKNEAPLNSDKFELYFVGYDKEHAKENFPFDDWYIAEEYSRDNPGTKVYVAKVTVDFSTLEEFV